MPEIRIQPTDAQLVPGQSVQIPIVVVIDKPTKVRGLHACFHGAEETTAEYTTYNAATKCTETHTTIEHLDIVKREFVLSGKEQRGLFSNVTDAMATALGGGEHELLQPGEYAFEIEIELPENAKPSFTGMTCRVFYEVSSFIDIPIWRDVKTKVSFEVPELMNVSEPTHESVRTRYPEDGDRGLIDSVLMPDVRVEAAIADGVLHEGDTLEGMFVVESPKQVSFRSIEARLIAIESTNANEWTGTYTHKGEPIKVSGEGEIDGKFSTEFQMPVVNPGGKTLSGENFSVDCFLQIELDVPWAKDPKIRVPITLL